MERKSAAISFLAVCIILAILLLTKTISSTASGILFAVALAGLGIASRGFRHDVKKSK